MLISIVAAGARSAVPTNGCAARWNTVSMSYSASERSMHAGSQMSPRTTITLRSSPSSSRLLPGTPSRKRHTTCAPRSTSALTSQPPKNPPPPVTNTGRPCHEKSFTISPPLPRCMSLIPDLGQGHLVLVRVHAGPEALVLVRHELTLGGDLRQHVF